MREIIIAGSGPSSVGFKYPKETPILAVSSGYRNVPRMEHFATLDRAMCFPEWVTDSTRWAKHIADWDNAEGWRDLPRVHEWVYSAGTLPNFKNGAIKHGPLRKRNALDTWHNSLLFAVQVAAQLGYTRHIFVGVDLLGDLAPVSDALAGWHKAACDAGLEWRNASQMSTLCEWMPEYEPPLLTRGGVTSGASPRDSFDLAEATQPCH